MGNLKQSMVALLNLPEKSQKQALKQWSQTVSEMQKEAMQEVLKLLKEEAEGEKQTRVQELMKTVELIEVAK